MRVLIQSAVLGLLLGATLALIGKTIAGLLFRRSKGR